MGSVSISNTTTYTIHEEETATLHVRDIDVPEEHRGKGIARAILLYGLCHSMEKCPDILYSDLEDDTPFAEDNARNLYYEFGFRFKTPDEKQEKMVELRSFQRNEMKALYPKVLHTFFKGKETRRYPSRQTHRANKPINRVRSKSKSRRKSKSRSRSRTRKNKPSV
jgi:hypothetical protein